MAADFPYPYPYSEGEALRLKETQLYKDSFRLNVRCARSIEQAIRDYFNETDEVLTDGCAQSILERYGFRRVCFVLSNSVKEMGMPYLLSDDARQWAQRTFVPPDRMDNCHFAVDTAVGLLESFIHQTREAYQALGMFSAEHCIHGGDIEDYTGKVLVLSPDALNEGHWSPRDQLWLATGGAGCSPGKLGRTVFATCLADGEETRWGREDFTGILDEQYLPDWAAEKLVEFRGPRQEQAPSGGMEMR